MPFVGWPTLACTTGSCGSQPVWRVRTMLRRPGKAPPIDSNVLRPMTTVTADHAVVGHLVLLHQPIQQRGFGAMPGIAWRVEKWRRAWSPHSDGAGHGKRPCNGRGRKRLCKVA